MLRWILAGMLAAAPAAASAQAAVPTLEERLQRVEDELAIRRVLIDYARLLDERDYAGYADQFTLDGEWTKPEGGGRKGRAAIRAMLEEALGPAGAPNAANYHLVSNPRIDLHGDRARATSRYLLVMRGADGQPVPSLAGVYHDELVRHDGEWMIARRVAEDIMPTPDEWRAIIAAQDGAR